MYRPCSKGSEALDAGLFKSGIPFALFKWGIHFEGPIELWSFLQAAIFKKDFHLKGPIEIGKSLKALIKQRIPEIPL